MPASQYAYGRLVLVPYTEVAMQCNLAGQVRFSLEEDTFANGNTVPMEDRNGCYVLTEQGTRVPMLKTEAGWETDTRPACPEGDTNLLRQVYNHARLVADGEAVDAAEMLLSTLRGFLNGAPR